MTKMLSKILVWIGMNPIKSKVYMEIFSVLMACVLLRYLFEVPFSRIFFLYIATWLYLSGLAGKIITYLVHKYLIPVIINKIQKHKTK